MNPRETLTAFDRYLADRGLRFEAVVVGATALNLLGVVVRTTKDCDVLAPPVPAAIAAAARAFAAELRARGEILDDEWLNDGPGSLAAQLLPAWQARTRPVFTGAR